MPAESAEGPQRWFYLLGQPQQVARYVFAAKLAEKAITEGDRVCLFCDDQEQAALLDDLLWRFRPDSFLPHEIVADGAVTPIAPVGLMWSQPAPEDWETLLVMAPRLPAQADRFQRLALVAHNDPATLDQARGLYRQLRELGCTPRVHDARKR